MHFLVVDDDPLLCENVESKLQRLLGPGKVTLEAAHNVVDAELALGRRVPDVLITDLNMPGLSGLVLIKRAKKQWPGLRIYVLSGYDDYSLVRQAFLNGATDYLLKPVDIEELREKVLCSAGPGAASPLHEEKSGWQMEKAVRYIDENISQNLTMDEVAAQVAVSYNYFSRLFKEHTGSSFPEYVHRQRIELSKRYLADPSVKVADIARKVGYDSSSTFSRAFKKYEGCYPTDYRQQLEWASL